MQEAWVWSLGQEDLLEKGMATHSRFLPAESHEQRSLVGYSPYGHKELDVTEWLRTQHTHFVLLWRISLLQNTFTYIILWNLGAYFYK